MTFWQKVDACQHEWTDYHAQGPCGTPYCDWHEEHCRKCGVYKVTCDCGACNGFSGWPWRRLSRLWNKAAVDNERRGQDAT